MENKRHTLIDWLSFTTYLGESDGKTLERALESLGDHIADDFDETVAMAVTSGPGWEFRSGRRPYKGGYYHPESGRYVWAGGQNHALIEFSGAGCRYLDDLGLMDDVLKAVGHKATRLDIAVDIVSELDPRAFVNAGYSGNIKTRNERVSGSGTTVTLGSWKSERFVNVYRYNPPHPRSDRLRVEFRLKRDYARSACAYAAQYGAQHVVSMLQNSYKFEHELWEVPMVSERLSGAENHSNKASTLRWIIKQVAPAIRRLVREGVIEDPEEFFAEHFMPDNIQKGLFDNER